MKTDAGITIKLRINNEELIMKNALKEIVHRKSKIVHPQAAS
jgi:hypothetical protein